MRGETPVRPWASETAVLRRFLSRWRRQLCSGSKVLELESELGNNRGSGVAHIEPADVLSGLGEGSEVPESTTKLDGAEEEEGSAGLDAVAPGSV